MNPIVIHAVYSTGSVMGQFPRQRFRGVLFEGIYRRLQRGQRSQHLEMARRTIQVWKATGRPCELNA